MVLLVSYIALFLNIVAICMLGIIIHISITDSFADQKSNPNISGGYRDWSWKFLYTNFTWSLKNRIWIVLLCLVPYLGIAVLVSLGIKNRITVTDKRWDSEHKFTVTSL